MTASTTGTLVKQKEKESPMDAEMQRGIAASEAGDKATAESIFRDIVSRDPQALEAWVWLGWTSANLDDAEGAFRRATELDPNNEEAQLGVRWVASQRDDAEASQARQSTQVEAAEPAAPPATMVVAPMHSAQEPQAPAETAFEYVAAPVESPYRTGMLTETIEPEFQLDEEDWSADAAMEQGKVAAQTGYKRAAHAIFTKVADRHPHSAAAWVWMGGTSPTLDDAENAFQRAIAIDASNEEAALGLRWVALRRQVMHQTSGLDIAAPDTTGLAVPVPTEPAAPETAGEVSRKEPFFTRPKSTLNLSPMAKRLIVAVVAVYIALGLWWLIATYF